VRIDGSRRIDVLEVDDCSGRRGLRPQGPAVARGLGRPGDLVVERLRQSGVPGRAAVAPDQAPAGRRSDRRCARQARADGGDQHIAADRGRRARKRKRRPERRRADDSPCRRQGAQPAPGSGDRQAEDDGQPEQSDMATKDVDELDSDRRASGREQLPHGPLRFGASCAAPSRSSRNACGRSDLPPDLTHRQLASGFWTLAASCTVSIGRFFRGGD